MYVPILSCILISRREHEREFSCDVIRTHRTNRKSCLSENPYRICWHPIRAMRTSGRVPLDSIELVCLHGRPEDKFMSNTNWSQKSRREVEVLRESDRPGSDCALFLFIAQQIPRGHTLHWNGTVYTSFSIFFFFCLRRKMVSYTVFVTQITVPAQHPVQATLLTSLYGYSATNRKALVVEVGSRPWLWDPCFRCACDMHRALQAHSENCDKILICTESSTSQTCISF
jgi:hypothetical protein